VLACAKHYVGDGGTTRGIDQGNTECDEATLRRIHLPGYIAAIKAGAGSVMVSYNSWNGQKLHGHRYLVTDVLKGELGFKGFVVSDWAGVDQLTNNYKAAIEKAINAGVDMAMIPAGPGEKNNYVEYIGHLKTLVAEKRIPMSRIDDAVLRILRVKQQMGLFEEPYTDRRLLDEVGCREHREVARACVRESLVLLKNTDGVLPLSRKAKRIHLAGRGADNLGMQCGGWTIDWQGRMGPVTSGGTTVLAGLKKAVSGDTQITFSADGSGAAGADVAIVVIGETPYAEMKGDSKDLALAPEEVATVEKVKGAGVPVVTVVLSGRPVILGRVVELSDALVAAWLPGTEGEGVTDVLLGEVAPKGKLPCTWPRSMDQVGKGAGGQDPLFPYGFGLTYSKQTAHR
jgi:beta-glucosidase